MSSSESGSIEDYLISSPEPPSPTSSCESVSSETTESSIRGDDLEQTLEDSSPNDEKMDYEQTQSGEASPPQFIPLVGVDPEQIMEDSFLNDQKMDYEQTQSGEAMPPQSMAPLVGVDPEQTMEESSPQLEKMDSEQTQSGEGTLVIWQAPEVTPPRPIEIISIQDDEATPSPQPLTVVRREDKLHDTLTEIVSKQVKFLLEVSHNNQRIRKAEDESTRMMSQQVENDGSGSIMKEAAKQVDEQNTPATEVGHESSGMKEATKKVDEQKIQAPDAVYESDTMINKAAEGVDEQKIQVPDAVYESDSMTNKAAEGVDEQKIQAPDAVYESDTMTNKAVEGVDEQKIQAPDTVYESDTMTNKSIEGVHEEKIQAPDAVYESDTMTNKAAEGVDEQKIQAPDAVYESDTMTNKAAKGVDEQKIQSHNAGLESGGRPNKAAGEVNAQMIEPPESGHESGGRGHESGGRPNKAASRKRSRLATKSVAIISDVSFIVPTDSMVEDEIVNQFVPKDADLKEAIAQRTRRFTFVDRLNGWTMETRERLNAPFKQLDKYFTHAESKVVARSVPEVVRFLIYEVSPKQLREAAIRLQTEEGYIVKSRKRLLKGGSSTRQSLSPRVVSWGDSENDDNHEKEYTKLFMKVAWNNLMNTIAEVVPSFSEFKAARTKTRVTTQASTSRNKDKTTTQSQPHEAGSSFIPNILPTLDAEAVEKEVAHSESESEAAKKKSRLTTQSKPDEGVSGIPPNMDVEAVETANALVDLKDHGE